MRDGIANVLGDLSESLHGVRVVTAHNRQARNIVHHRNVVGAYQDANNYTAQINAVYGPGTQMLGYLAQAAILAIGGTFVLHGSLSVGNLTAFFLYVSRFMLPIQLLVAQYNLYQQGQSSMVKLRSLFAVQPNVPEDPDAIELPPIQGDIEFERRVVRLQPGCAGHPRRRPAGAGRRDGRLRRAHRRREVDDGQTSDPLLRSDRRDGS